MSNIPTYGAQKVEPAQAQAPRGHVEAPSYDALRAGVAGLAEGAQEVGAAIARQQHQARVARATDAATDYKNDVITTLDGGTPEADQNAPVPDVTKMTDEQFGQFLDGPKRQGGFLSTRGDQALAQRTDTLDSLTKRRQQIAEGINDSTARDMFLHESSQDLMQARARIESHTSQQIEVAQQDTVNGLKVTTLRDIANNPGNDKLASEQEASVVGRMGALAHSEDGLKGDIAKWQQQITATRLDSMLGSRDWRTAEQLFSRDRQRLGESADTYEKAIAQARAYGEGTQTALDVVTGARKQNGFIDEAKATAAFEGLDPDQKTQAAQTAFDHLMTMESARERSVKSDAFDSALSSYLERHNLNDVSPKTRTWMIANDPKGWHALEQVVHSDHAAAQGAPPTDAQRRAMTQFEVDLYDHPDKYATMGEKDFNATVWPQLAKNDRERAGALFATAHGRAAKPGTLDPAESKMLLQTGRDAGLFPAKQNDPSKWVDDQAELFYKANEKLTEQATAFRKANGKPPPFELVKKWTDDLMLSGKIPHSGWLWDTKTTRLEALTKGSGFAPTWSDEERAKAAKALKAAGLPPTDEAIDTHLRRVHGLNAPATQAPPPPQKPPSTAADANSAAGWGLDLSESTPDYGD